MRFYACGQCRHVYQVAGSLEELKSLLDTQESATPSCITNFCQGTMKRVKSSLPGFKQEEVPLNSFFRAINGFGLSKGDPASAARFVEIIKTKKIVNALVEPVGQPERVIVKQLICEDGTRLHFDTSARGACCYFIEEPGPSCLEVFDAQYSGDAEDPGGRSSKGGEEAGRAPEADSETSDARSGGESPSTTPADEQSGADTVPAVPEARDLLEVHPSGTGSGDSNLRV